MVQIIRRNTLHPFDELRAEMERVFGGLTPAARGTGADGVRIDVDLSETEQSFVVRAEVPGIEPEKLEVTATGDRLVLAGEKVDAHEEQADGRRHSERRFGSFRRELVLPAEIDPAGVRAEHAHGVLTVTLPKAGLQRPHRIEIRAS